MNTLINIFLIFIFIIVILFFKVPNIENNNYLLHKLIIFALIFIFQFFILTMHKMVYKCKIDIFEILSYSAETAAIAVIGYSFYTDLQYYKIDDFNYNIFSFDNDSLQYIYIAIIITLLLTFVNTIKLLSGFKPYECIKYE